MPGTMRTFHVPDISCDHCKQTIESEVGQLEGVAEVVVDVDTKVVTVDGIASREAVSKAIEDAGYDIGPT